MSKYLILVFLFALVMNSFPQNVESFLDQPFTDRKLKLQVTGSYFNGLSVMNVINTLTSMSFGAAGSNTWGHYWTEGDINALRTDLLSYYNGFPQSSEVFSATLANGVATYVDSYGSRLTPQSGQNLDNYFPVDSYNYLTFYAGRNTAAGSNSYHSDYYSDYGTSFSTSDKTSEIIINTSDGKEYRIYGYDTATPIVLDLDGDNKLEASNGQWLPHNFQKGMRVIAFDINADGFDELVEWVGVNDGLLVTCEEGEKVSGKNLYGNALGYVHGFEQLSVLDVNKDKKLTEKELSTLKVWQDKNGNALVESGELKTVVELGITELSLEEAELKSTFVQDGKTKSMWDWHPVMVLVKKNR